MHSVPALEMQDLLPARILEKLIKGTGRTRAADYQDLCPQNWYGAVSTECLHISASFLIELSVVQVLPLCISFYSSQSPCCFPEGTSSPHNNYLPFFTDFCPSLLPFAFIHLQISTCQEHKHLHSEEEETKAPGALELIPPILFSCLLRKGVWCNLNFQVSHKVGLTVVTRASYERLLSEMVVGTVPAAECCLSSAPLGRK